MHSKKCLVFGCENTVIQGAFNGDLCGPCYQMLTTGKIGVGTTFIHGFVSGVRLRWLEMKSVKDSLEYNLMRLE